MDNVFSGAIKFVVKEAGGGGGGGGTGGGTGGGGTGGWSESGGLETGSTGDLLIPILIAILAVIVIAGISFLIAQRKKAKNCAGLSDAGLSNLTRSSISQKKTSFLNKFTKIIISVIVACSLAFGVFSITKHSNLAHALESKLSIDVSEITATVDVSASTLTFTTGTITNNTNERVALLSASSIARLTEIGDDNCTWTIKSDGSLIYSGPSYVKSTDPEKEIERYELSEPLYIEPEGAIPISIEVSGLTLDTAKKLGDKSAYSCDYVVTQKKTEEEQRAVEQEINEELTVCRAYVNDDLTNLQPADRNQILADIKIIAEEGKAGTAESESVEFTDIIKQAMDKAMLSKVSDGVRLDVEVPTKTVIEKLDKLEPALTPQEREVYIAEIEGYENDLDENLDKATSIEEINTLREDYNENIQKVYEKAAFEQEKKGALQEVEAQTKAAKTEIANKPNLTEAHKTALNNKLDTSLAWTTEQMSGAATSQDVQLVKEKGIGLVNVVRNAATSAEAIDSCKDGLSENDRESYQKEIQQLIDETNANVKKAASQEEIDEAVNAGKAAMEEVAQRAKDFNQEKKDCKSYIASNIDKAEREIKALKNLSESEINALVNRVEAVKTQSNSDIEKATTSDELEIIKQKNDAEAETIVSGARSIANINSDTKLSDTQKSSLKASVETAIDSTVKNITSQTTAEGAEFEKSRGDTKLEVIAKVEEGAADVNSLSGLSQDDKNIYNNQLYGSDGIITKIFNLIDKSTSSQGIELENYRSEVLVNSVVSGASHQNELSKLTDLSEDEKKQFGQDMQDLADDAIKEIYSVSTKLEMDAIYTKLNSDLDELYQKAEELNTEKKTARADIEKKGTASIDDIVKNTKLSDSDKQRYSLMIAAVVVEGDEKIETASTKEEVQLIKEKAFGEIELVDKGAAATGNVNQLTDLPASQRTTIIDGIDDVIEDKVYKIGRAETTEDINLLKDKGNKEIEIINRGAVGSSVIVTKANLTTDQKQYFENQLTGTSPQGAVPYAVEEIDDQYTTQGTELEHTRGVALIEAVEKSSDTLNSVNVLENLSQSDKERYESEIKDVLDDSSDDIKDAENASQIQTLSENLTKQLQEILNAAEALSTAKAQAKQELNQKAGDAISNINAKTNLTDTQKSALASEVNANLTQALSAVTEAEDLNEITLEKDRGIALIATVVNNADNNDNINGNANLTTTQKANLNTQVDDITSATETSIGKQSTPEDINFETLLGQREMETVLSSGTAIGNVNVLTNLSDQQKEYYITKLNGTSPDGISQYIVKTIAKTTTDTELNLETHRRDALNNSVAKSSDTEDKVYALPNLTDKDKAKYKSSIQSVLTDGIDDVKDAENATTIDSIYNQLEKDLTDILNDATDFSNKKQAAIDAIKKKNAEMQALIDSSTTLTEAQKVQAKSNLDSDANTAITNILASETEDEINLERDKGLAALESTEYAAEGTGSVTSNTNLTSAQITTFTGEITTIATNTKSAITKATSSDSATLEKDRGNAQVNTVQVVSTQVGNINVKSDLTTQQITYYNNLLYGTSPEGILSSQNKNIASATSKTAFDFEDTRTNALTLSINDSSDTNSGINVKEHLSDADKTTFNNEVVTKIEAALASIKDASTESQITAIRTQLQTDLADIANRATELDTAKKEAKESVTQTSTDAKTEIDGIVGLDSSQKTAAKQNVDNVASDAISKITASENAQNVEVEKNRGNVQIYVIVGGAHTSGDIGSNESLDKTQKSLFNSEISKGVELAKSNILLKTEYNDMIFEQVKAAAKCSIIASSAEEAGKISTNATLSTTDKNYYNALVYSNESSAIMYTTEQNIENATDTDAIVLEVARGNGQLSTVDISVVGDASVKGLEYLSQVDIETFVALIRDKQTKANTDIKDATTEASITAIVDKLQTDVNEIVSEATEFNTYKKEAIEALNAFATAEKAKVDAMSGLTTDEKESYKKQIDSTVTTETTNIKNAVDKETIDTSLARGKATIEVTTKNSEGISVLNEAANLTTTQKNKIKNQINTIASSAKTKISAQTTEEGFSLELQKCKDDIDVAEEVTNGAATVAGLSSIKASQINSYLELLYGTDTQGVIAYIDTTINACSSAEESAVEKHRGTKLVEVICKDAAGQNSINQLTDLSTDDVTRYTTQLALLLASAIDSIKEQSQTSEMDALVSKLGQAVDEVVTDATALSNAKQQAKLDITNKGEAAKTTIDETTGLTTTQITALKNQVTAAVKTATNLIVASTTPEDAAFNKDKGCSKIDVILAGTTAISTVQNKANLSNSEKSYYNTMLSSTGDSKGVIQVVNENIDSKTTKEDIQVEISRDTNLNQVIIDCADTNSLINAVPGLSNDDKDKYNALIKAKLVTSVASIYDATTTEEFETIAADAKEYYKTVLEEAISLSDAKIAAKAEIDTSITTTKTSIESTEGLSESQIKKYSNSVDSLGKSGKEAIDDASNIPDILIEKTKTIAKITATGRGAQTVGAIGKNDNLSSYEKTTITDLSDATLEVTIDNLDKATTSDDIAFIERRSIKQFDIVTYGQVDVGNINVLAALDSEQKEYYASQIYGNDTTVGEISAAVVLIGIKTTDADVSIEETRGKAAIDGVLKAAQGDSSIYSLTNLSEDDKKSAEDAVNAKLSTYLKQIVDPKTAQEISDLQAAFNNDISSIVKAATDLDTSKGQAKTQIETKVASVTVNINSLSDLTADDKDYYLNEYEGTVVVAGQNALANIIEAKTIEEVTAVTTAGIAALDAQNSDASEFNTSKKNAKDSLSAKQADITAALDKLLSEGSLTQEQYDGYISDLTFVKTAGDNAIIGILPGTEEGHGKAAIEAELKIHLANMDKILESAQFQAAKNIACAELEAYASKNIGSAGTPSTGLYAISGLTITDIADFTTIINTETADKCKDIQDATTVEEIEMLLTAGKTEIDSTMESATTFAGWKTSANTELETGLATDINELDKYKEQLGGDVEGSKYRTYKGELTTLANEALDNVNNVRITQDEPQEKITAAKNAGILNMYKNLSVAKVDANVDTDKATIATYTSLTKEQIDAYNKELDDIFSAAKTTIYSELTTEITDIDAAVAEANFNGSKAVNKADVENQTNIAIAEVNNLTYTTKKTQFVQTLENTCDNAKASIGSAKTEEEVATAKAAGLANILSDYKTAAKDDHAQNKLACDDVIDTLHNLTKAVRETNPLSYKNQLTAQLESGDKSIDSALTVALVTSQLNNSHTKLLAITSDAETENANSYWTVKFVTDHGSVADITTKQYGDALAASEKDIVISGDTTGYDFDHWYKEQAYTNTWDFTNDKVGSSLGDQDICQMTLYAKWNVHSYTITWNYDESVTPGSAGSTSYTIESTSITMAGDPTSTGRSFVGWLASSTTPGQKYAGWPTEVFYDESLIHTLSSAYGDVTLTPQWVVNEYNIDYSINGGTWAAGYTPPTKYSFGEGATLPTDDNIARTDCSFEGWFDNPSFSGEPVTEIGVLEWGDKNFYALWELKDAPVASDYTFKADDFTYDGNEHTATVTPNEGAGEVTSTTYLKYNEVTGKYEEITGAPVDAGQYKVQVNVAESETHRSGTITDDTWVYTGQKAEATIDLDKTSDAITFPADTTLQVTNYVGDGTLSAVSGDTSIATLDSSVPVVGTDLGITSVHVGDVTITVSATEGKNYKAKSVTFDLSISAGTITPTVTPATGLVYDRTAHSTGTVSATLAKSTAIIKYGKTAESVTSTSEITQEDAGTYITYYEVSATDYTTVTGNFSTTIDQKSVADLTDITIVNPSYTAEAAKPTVTIKHNGATLAETTEYTTECTDINAGPATVTIKGTGNYKGENTQSFVIEPRDIADKDVSIEDISDVTYNAAAQEPELTVKYKNVEISLGTDFSVAYTNNINAGNKSAGANAPTATITGMGNFKNTNSKTFTILPRSFTDKEDIEIVQIEDVEYTGEPQKIVPVVKYKGVALSSTTDYDTTWDGACINVGPVTATAAGKGNFKDEISTTYNITSKKVTVTARDATKVYGDADPELEADVTGALPGAWIDYTVSRTIGEDVGDTLEVIPTGETTQGPYTVTYVNADFTITPKDLSTAGTEIVFSSIDPVTFNNQEWTPDFTITYNCAVEGPKVLEKDEEKLQHDYKATYSDNLNAGTAKITIEPHGNYTGTTYIYFTILQAPMTVTAQSASKIYDDAEPELTVDIEGLVKGDTFKPTYSISRVAGEDVIDEGYAITVTGVASQQNYYVTFVSTGAVLKIRPRTINTFAISAIADQTYTGSPIVPTAFTVSDTSKSPAKVLATTDYTYECTDNIDVGTANLIVTGKGNYQGHCSSTFEITPKSLEDRDVAIASIDTQTFDNANIQPKPSVTFNGMTLTEENDIEYSWENNFNVTTSSSLAKVTVTAKKDGNYTGSKSKTFRIIARSTKDAGITITVDDSSLVYSGDAQTPNVTVTYTNSAGTTATLVADTDYTLSYRNNIKAEESTASTAPTAVITGKGNFKESNTKTFTIQPLDINDKNVTVDEIADIPYDGKAHKVAPKVSFNGSTLSSTNDYSVKYLRLNESKEKVETTDFTTQGTIYVQITGKGNFKNTRETSYSISGKSIKSATVEPISAVVYNTKVQHPEPVLTDDGKTLVKQTEEGGAGDYKLEYTTECINAGQHTIKITGVNNYADSREETFTINPAPATVTADDKEKYYGVADEALTAKTSGLLEEEGKRPKIAYDVDRVEGEDVGTYTITPTGDALQGNYSISFVTAKYTINKVDINKNENVDIAAFVNKDYTGDAITQSTTVKFKTAIIAETLLVEGKDKDYTISFTNNINAGTAYATIIINDDCKNFTGQSEPLSFTINKINASVSIDDTTKVYDESDPTFTATSTGTVKGQKIDVSITRDDIGEKGDEDVGDHGLTLTVNESSAINKNYNISATTTGTLSITKRDINTLSFNAIADKTFTGSNIEPLIPAVSIKGATLDKGTDYTATYSNVRDVATSESANAPTAEYTGSGNYTGTKTIKFNITPVLITKLTVTFDTVTYNGRAQTPEPTVKLNGTELVSGTDYELSNYQNNTNAGDASVTITGKGNVTGAYDYTFTISKADLSSTSENWQAQVVYPTDGYQYTSQEIEPTVKLINTSPSPSITIDASNYDVSYENNIDAGTNAKFTITGNDTNILSTSSLSSTFTISKRDISSAGVTAKNQGTLVYNQAEQKVACDVSYQYGATAEESVTAPSEDVETTYAEKGDYTNIGEKVAYVTISEKSKNWTGTRTVDSYVINRKDVKVKPNDVTVDYGESYTLSATLDGIYSGDEKKITYSINAYDSGGTIVSKPSAPGTYTLKSSFESADQDNYHLLNGEMVKEQFEEFTGTLTINAISLDSDLIEITYAGDAAKNDLEYAGPTGTTNEPTVKLNLEDGTTYTLVKDVDYKVTYEDNTEVTYYPTEWKKDPKGPAKVKITTDDASLTRHVITGSKTKEYQIHQKACTITIDDQSKTYGEEDPEFTSTATGVCTGDTLDYGLERVAGTDVGTYKISLDIDYQETSPNYNYNITSTDGQLTIIAKAASLLRFTIADLEFNGAAQTPIPTINDPVSGKALEYGTDKDFYASTVTNNRNAKQATAQSGAPYVKYTFNKNYTGNVEKYFTISPVTDSSKITYDGLEDTYPYTGEEIKPDPVLKIGDNTLTLNSDYYNPTYTNNTDPGTATMTYIASDNLQIYPWTKTFTIAKTQMDEVKCTFPELTYNTAEQKPSADEIEFYVGDENSKIILSSSLFTVSDYANCKDAGEDTATCKITSKDQSVVEGDPVDKTYSIDPLDISTDTAFKEGFQKALSSDEIEYDGTEHKDDAVITSYVYVNDTLTFNKDYTAAFSTSVDYTNTGVPVTGETTTKKSFTISIDSSNTNYTGSIDVYYVMALADASSWYPVFIFTDEPAYDGVYDQDSHTVDSQATLSNKAGTVADLEESGITLSASASDSGVLTVNDVSAQKFTLSNTASSQNFTQFSIEYSQPVLKQKAASITIDDMEVSEGSEVPTTFTYTLGGIIDGDTVTAVCETDYKKGDPEGTECTISFKELSGAQGQNYSIDSSAVTEGTLTVTEAKLKDPNFQFWSDNTFTKEIKCITFDPGSYAWQFYVSWDKDMPVDVEGTTIKTFTMEFNPSIENVFLGFIEEGKASVTVFVTPSNYAGILTPTFSGEAPEGYSGTTNSIAVASNDNYSSLTYSGMAGEQLIQLEFKPVISSTDGLDGVIFYDSSSTAIQPADTKYQMTDLADAAYYKICDSEATIDLFATLGATYDAVYSYESGASGPSEKINDDYQKFMTDLGATFASMDTVNADGLNGTAGESGFPGDVTLYGVSTVDIAAAYGLNEAQMFWYNCVNGTNGFYNAWSTGTTGSVSLQSTNDHIVLMQVPTTFTYAIDDLNNII